MYLFDWSLCVKHRRSMVSLVCRVCHVDKKLLCRQTQSLTYNTFGSREYQRKHTSYHFIILSHIYFEYDALPVSARAFTCVLK